MKNTTLIIHPEDSTTVFLKDIYKDIPDKTVVQGGVTKKEIEEMIQSHDRIMMMGHGSPSGLFSVGQFPDTRIFIIDSSMTSLLEAKKDSVFIWCYADKFLESTALKGFATGMFISEIGEALICGVKSVSQDMIDTSNSCFVDVVAKHVHLPAHDIYTHVMRGEYMHLAKTNPVAKYNYERMYYN